MKNNWFEQKLNDRLSQKEEQLDLNRMWDQLEEKRNPKKSNRKLLWIPLFGLMVAVLSVAFFSNKWNADKVNDTPLISHTTEVQSSEDATLGTTPGVQTKTNNEESTASNELNLNTNDNTPSENKSNYISQSSIVSTANNNNFQNKTAQIINQRPLGESQTNAYQIESNNKIAATQNSRNNITQSNTFNTYNVVTTEQITSNSKKNEIIIDRLSDINVERIMALDLGLSFDNDQAKIRNKEIVLKQSWDKHLDDHSKSERNALPWIIGLEQNLGICSRNLEDANDDLLTKKRNIEEEFLDFQKYQITLRKFISDNLFFETGLAYSQYTSRSIIDVNVISTTQEIDTVEILVNHQGELLNAVTGEVNSIRNELTKNTRYQKYGALSIPLNLGYHFQISEKSKIGLIAGIDLNIININRGQVINHFFENDDYIDLKSAGYDRNFGLGSNFQLIYETNIGHGYDLIIGVNTHFDLTNRISNGSGLSDKFRSYNLKLGFLKQF